MIPSLKSAISLGKETENSNCELNPKNILDDGATRSPIQFILP